METRDYLARQHRRVVDEFICAVVEEWAGDMGQVERNVLGVALRGEIETRLVPELLALHALLLGVDSETLGRLPAWLDTVQAPLTLDRDFFEEMARRLDPDAFGLLEENSVLLPGESEAAGPSRTAFGRWRRWRLGHPWGREALEIHLKWKRAR